MKTRSKVCLSRNIIAFIGCLSHVLLLVARDKDSLPSLRYLLTILRATINRLYIRGEGRVILGVIKISGHVAAVIRVTRNCRAELVGIKADLAVREGWRILEEVQQTLLVQERDHELVGVVRAEMEGGIGSGGTTVTGQHVAYIKCEEWCSCIGSSRKHDLITAIGAAGCGEVETKGESDVAADVGTILR